jgi:hypothetical protein
MRKHIRLFGGLAASIVGVLVTCGVAAAQTPQAAANQDSSPGADIKVHGHWAIEVRNGDGSIASHTEFENACRDCGMIISAILGRMDGSWQWAVQFVTPTILPDQVCKTLSGDRALCQINEAALGDSGEPDSFFPNLTVNADVNAGILELNGHFTTSFAGVISDVFACVNLSNPPNLWIFSQRQLASALDLAAGQQVYVKVTFSFS